jgi:V8-like Glu-specific endopeptidase
MIFKEDCLMKVSKEHLEANPFKNIGFIEIITYGSEGLGTGTLISPNLVLTSAHIICSRNYPEHPSDPTKNHMAK